MPINSLVIGHGSIGQRHKSLLEQMGHNVYVVTSKKKNCFFLKKIEDAFKEKKFQYIIIANKTSDHYGTLLELIKYGYQGPLLIEKPVFDQIRPLPEYNFSNVFVAYNLRFHPIIQKIRSLTCERKIFSMQVYVGQYLPDWRPLRDYKKSYSASREKGGGVLRDLSHELDYIEWLTGGWKNLTAIGGIFGDLKINSDDVYGLLLETQKCPVVVLQMNYLDRTARREIIINMEGISLKADLIANTLQIGTESTHYDIPRDQMYLDQHLSILDGKTDYLCSFETGMQVLNLIKNVEETSANKIWKQKQTF